MIVTTAPPAPDELHPLCPLYDPPLPVGLLHQPREEGVGVSSPDAATLPVRATAAVRQRELEHVSRVRLVSGHVSRVKCHKIITLSRSSTFRPRLASW